MSKVKMISPAVPNVPWQDKPEGHTGAPVWRYSENPIIGRNPVEGVARIFNSAVMPYGDEFIGVFRGEQVNGIPYIYLGRSKDAIHWDFDKNKIQFVDEEGKPFMPIYAYDPRLVKVEDTYYIIWCQDFYGAAIGIAKTTDFKTFVRIENPFLPFNRNAVLFPRKVHGNFMMLSRPSDSGHTPFGDIFVSESPDMVYWGKHRHVMGKSSEWWESLKIGGGAAPIENFNPRSHEGSDTPVKLARAIKAKIDEKWTSEKIYSDDNTEEVITSYEGTDVELEINALAPQDRVILFGQLYEKGFLRKSSDDRAPEVAVGWRERKLNGKYEFKWLYVGKFAEGISEEASTKEGKLSPTTKSIKGSFYERSIDNLYEVSVDESNLVAEDTDAATAIKDWFSKVQEAPDAAA